MAAIRTNGSLDLDALADYVTGRFPKYQRPFFIRVLTDEGMRTTSTFKHQKTDYRDEGFDPRTVHDPLYFLDDDRYVPIDEALYARFEAGDVTM